MAVDPFINQLAGLCRHHPTVAKWLFVPTHAVGHTLGEQMAREGMNWLNLRFIPPLDLARETAAPFLIERGIDPAPDALGPALIMWLLLGLPVFTPSYFRDLAKHPKMADSLWESLQELRLTGIHAADLPRSAFASEAKHSELQALLAAYEAHLDARRVADPAAVYSEALQHLEACPVLAGDLVIELPGVIWSPVQRKFLDALPGHRLTPSTLRLAGLAPSRRLALLAAPEAPVPPLPACDAERLAFLLAPAEAPPSKHDGTLAMFRAGGREAEVEEVFRRILKDRAPFDQVEIACAASEYAAIFWEKAQLHGWPLTVGPGVPITLTRPARALLAFCAWIAQGFPASGLRRLLQSGDVRLEVADGPTAGQAARLLAKSDATWGRQTYAAALGGLAESSRRRAEDPESDAEVRASCLARAARAERLGEWIAELLSLVPAPAPDGRIALGSLVAGCSAFLKAAASTGSALDASGESAIAGALAELEPLGELECPLADGLAIIRERIDRLCVGGDRARPGHLYVSLLDQAGWAGRPYTFIVGLEEGGVFPTPVEDPVLLDVERASLGPALATSGDRLGEALHRILARLAVLSGRVCLSFSCRDLRENRETFPSWLLLQALRLQDPEAALTYDDLNRVLSEPVSVIPDRPDEAVDDAGWWLARLRRAGLAGRPSVEAVFPALAQGEIAEQARISDRMTVYDGLVVEAGVHLDPRRSGQPVSATRLEGLAACPFQHFLERGLGLEAVEETEPDPDQWLDPLTRGSALHSLFAAILREVRDGGKAIHPSRHLPRLLQLGEAKLAELRALIPPPSARVFERERDEFLRDLEVFLTLEAETSGRVPVGLEIAFGGGAPEGESLARAEPVSLDLGADLRFSLRGRIDRLDRLADGTFEVVDYKTGRYWPDDWEGTFAAGRTLQHALYAVAARELLRARHPMPRIASSSYYFPTTRGRGERVVRPQAGPGALAAVLRDLFELVNAGTFLAAPGSGACRYCEFARTCGAQPADRAARKLANEANPVLAALRRLLQHA